MLQVISTVKQKATAAWRAGSHTGPSVYETQPLTDDHIEERNDELAWLMKKNKGFALHNGHLAHGQPSGDFLNLMRREAMRWRRMNEALRDEGALVANSGMYTGPGAIANGAALSAVTGAATILGWWSTNAYSPIPANSIKAPSAFRIIAAGTVTSTAAGQTLAINTGIGVSAQGAAPTSRVTMGDSNGLALGSTIAGAFWRLEYDAIVRVAGPAGNAVGNGMINWGTAAGATPGTPTATNPSGAMFGGGATVATPVDFVNSTQGLVIAGTASAAGVSVTPQMVQYASYD